MPVHLRLAVGQDAHLLGPELGGRGSGLDEVPWLLQVQFPERLFDRGDVHCEVGRAVHEAEKDRWAGAGEPFDVRGRQPAKLGAVAVAQQDVELPEGQEAGPGVPGRLCEPVLVTAFHVAPVQGIAGKYVCCHTSPQVRRNHHSAPSSSTARVNSRGSFQSATRLRATMLRRRRLLHQLLELRPVGVGQRGGGGEHPLAASPLPLASSSGRGRPSSFSSEGRATRKLCGCDWPRGFLRRGLPATSMRWEPSRRGVNSARYSPG